MGSVTHKSIAIFGFFILTLIACAEQVRANDQIDFGNPAFAATASKPTSIPVGHARFCEKHPAECRVNSQVVDAEPLTAEKWKQLLEVNAALNSRIVPVTDQELYKVDEFWTYPDGYGDCEDYALAKRRSLIELGWDPSTLMITVVRQPNGEGHAVLMARTDRGDLVLDNQEGLIKLWNETPYRYLKRQSQFDQAMWVDIYDSRPTVVASR